ncbi:hypothetical protein MANI_010573 [Metarhizium anisopliae]
MRPYFLALALTAATAPKGPAAEANIAKFGDTRPISNDPLPATGTVIPRQQPDGTEEIGFNVYVHVVGRPEETKAKQTEFLLTRDDVKSQMEVLNRSFKPVGISFKLAGVDWIAISTLAPYENPFSKILSNKELQGIHKGDDKGDNTTLNLYFLNGTNDYGGISQNFFYVKRSVFVNARTVPGGTEPSFNMGLTAVHEVGHWLGLVDVYKVKPSWGSEEDFRKARAACLKLNGPCDTQAECLNYMSYASDKCKNEFKFEQIRFMKIFAKEMLAGRTPLPIEIPL